MCATKKDDNCVEAVIEEYLRKRVKAIKGLCIKLSPLGYAGVPDRIVLLPGGIVLFFELKRPKGWRYEPLQLRWHSKLRKLGFKVFVCNTKASVDAALEEYHG